MKRLFYISGTVFFTTLTLLLGLQIAEQTAESKPPSPVPSPFIFWSANQGMKANGDVWVLNTSGSQDTPGHWSLAAPGTSLPVPASDIAFFDVTGGTEMLVTKEGAGWYFCGCWAPDVILGGWRTIGTVP